MGTIIFDTVPLTYFLKTLSLLISFEQWDLEIWYFTWVFLVIRPFSGYHYFWPLTLEFDPFFENFNLANIFWTVSDRALIFHMNIPCDMTFPWIPLFFTLWPLPWSLTHFFENFNFANNFWTVRSRALIFHLSIPCDENFPWVPLFFTFWPWSLNNFFGKLKPCLLLLNIECSLELWYFT